MNSNDADNFFIRKFQPADRERIRALCCDTGFLGDPIDPVFEDREVFADFLVNYYLDEEPESAFVVGKKGVLLGYLIGSRFHKKRKGYYLRKMPGLISKVIRRFSSYRQESRRFILWMICKGWHETPPVPKSLPHFHINLLPEARGVRSTRELIDQFLAHLRQLGEKGVYGQMVTTAHRRGERMFERFGFKLINRSEITKYQRYYPEPVYLSTVVKDFSENETLYRRRN